METPFTVETRNGTTFVVRKDGKTEVWRSDQHAFELPTIDLLEVAQCIANMDSSNQNLYPGVYKILAEELNNEVLDRWKEQQNKEKEMLEEEVAHTCPICCPGTPK